MGKTNTQSAETKTKGRTDSNQLPSSTESSSTDISNSTGSKLLPETVEGNEESEEGDIGGGGKSETAEAYLDDETIERLLRAEVLDGPLDLGRLISQQLSVSDFREKNKLSLLAVQLLQQKLPSLFDNDDSAYERLFMEPAVDDEMLMDDSSLEGSEANDNKAVTAETVAAILRTRHLKMTDLASPEMVSAVAEYLAITYPDLNLDIEPNLCARLFTGEWADKLEAALNAPPVEQRSTESTLKDLLFRKQ